MGDAYGAVAMVITSCGTCYGHSFHTMYCFNLRIKCSFSLPSITNIEAVTVKLFQKVVWVRVYLRHSVVYRPDYCEFSLYLVVKNGQ